MSIRILRNFNQVATLASAHQKDGRNIQPSDLSIINDASIVFDDEKIIWIGEDSKLPVEFQDKEFIDCNNKVCTPEIVDAHTHLVFGGDRAHEYSMRLNGATYEEIANAGGGILNTMNGTNNLNRNDLLKLAIERAKQIHSYGVGTIEIKSGYGLNFEKEYELSRIIFDLKTILAPEIQIKNTYMAAHAIPKDFKNSYDYMKEVVLPLLDVLADEKILDAVDIFHEQNYFSEDDVRSLFERSNRLGIPVKMHADEFNDNNGAALACSYNALSCDHLLKTSSAGIDVLAKSNTVANLLPGTGLFLGKEKANARAMLDAGVKVAIASDFNPGSCHCDNVLMLASIAAPMYKMNLAEMWTAITLNAAHSLGIKDQGAIVPGLKPRFSIFNTDCIDRVTYNWGKNLAIN